MEFTNKNKISFALLRGLSSLIFIIAGINHLIQTNQASARLSKSTLSDLVTWMAPPEILIILSGLGLLLGGILLLIGYKTKMASLLLISILIPITITVQLGNPEGLGPLFKNIAILGILLFFTLNGSMFYGVDQWLKNRSHLLQKNVVLKKYGVGLVLFILLFILVTIASAFRSTSKKSDSKFVNSDKNKQNYAVLISQPNHVKAVVNTAESINPASKYKRNSFVVMACGKSVEAFMKDSEFNKMIEAGKATGITYKICGMSLQQFNLHPDSLIKGIEVIPNGLTYMFDLQMQGYRTVEL